MSVRKCPNCGEEMDEDLSDLEICSECGEELDINDTYDDDEDIDEEDED